MLVIIPNDYEDIEDYTIVGDISLEDMSYHNKASYEGMEAMFEALNENSDYLDLMSNADRDYFRELGYLD